MRFGILGPLEVEVDGRPAAIAGRRQRSVLAVLLVADERSVTADQLIEQVWGRDLPANPANTLQHTVAQLRKVLEPGRPRNQPPQVLVSTDDGYRIDLTGHELDAREFEAHLAAASAAMTDGRAATAVATTEAALALWRGPALTEFDGVEAAEAEATRLAERLVDARQLAIDARSAVDGPAAVVAELESLVKEHPHREGLWARLMTALYQSQRQADALRTYQRAAATLADELGLVPSNELRQLEQRILQHDPGLAPKRAVPGNLPTPTNPLIGRQELTAVIAGALSRHRLVTLLGPGGAGKTRLAVEVGGAIVDHGGAHPDAGATGADGVWLARLDNLWDPSLLALSIGTTLGLAESPEGDVITNLAGHIGRRRLLLVLDNCEHLTEAVGALVARLLADCPHLVVLATSQAPLSVTGKHRVPVPPLGLPADGDSPFARLDAAPAIELFLARAAAVDLTRRLDDEELSAVANIVRALDGNPLAIELAAARTDVYTPTEIARLMADRFEVLAGGPRDVPERQRTLRSALAWSVGLLSDEERWFFARVSVFAGGFDTEAAATLTDTDEPAVRRLVAGLLARSVLGRDEAEGPDPRFRLLETVRLYGRSLLDDDELAAVRARHAEVFADRVARLEPQLGGPDQADAFRRYVLDGDNLRAAMAWSLDHPEGTAEPRRAPAAVDRLRPGVRIAARTGRFWD
ncbi:MAG: BTAD domain-containing putative transcriptional regulator, partial [Actinomycetota bacterium]